MVADILHPDIRVACLAIRKLLSTMLPGTGGLPDHESLAEEVAVLYSVAPTVIARSATNLITGRFICYLNNQHRSFPPRIYSI